MNPAPLTRAVLLSLTLGVAGTALAACEEQGPAEEAGEAMDESAEDAEDAVD